MSNLTLIFENSFGPKGLKTLVILNFFVSNQQKTTFVDVYRSLKPKDGQKIFRTNLVNPFMPTVSYMIHFDPADYRAKNAQHFLPQPALLCAKMKEKIKGFLMVAVTSLYDA